MENKREPTLEDLLSTINETLAAIQNHKGPINLTPELLADITQLEAAVTDFKETSDELFELFDVDIQSLKQEILESPTVRSGEKQLIKQAEDIERDARVLKLALSKSKGRGKDRNKQSDAGKQELKERRKLFKPLGGDKKWLPL